MISRYSKKAMPAEKGEKVINTRKKILYCNVPFSWMSAAACAAAPAAAAAPGSPLSPGIPFEPFSESCN